MNRLFHRWKAPGPILLLTVSVLLFLLCFAGEGRTAEEPLNVGFVYVGPVGDFGWTYTHDQGRKYLEEKLGDRVETTFIESVPQGSDSQRVFEQLASKDHDLIFGTAFGYQDFMLKVANKNPEKVFMHCSGWKTSDNMGNYFIRVYQGDYLAGMLAGYKTETNVLGYVAPHPIPQMARLIDAFTLGARSVNPDVTVKVVWTNTWYDPAKEREAAMSLIEAGADVLGHHQDSPATAQAAEQEGVYSFGKAADMSRFAPDAILGSVVYRWGPYYVRTVRGILNGTWEPRKYWGGMEDDVVDFVGVSDLNSAQARQKVMEVKEQMKRGEFAVFKGPIYDNHGTLRVHKGSRMSDEKMWSMKWYVKGVQGEFPD